MLMHFETAHEAHAHFIRNGWAPLCPDRPTFGSASFTKPWTDDDGFRGTLVGHLNKWPDGSAQVFVCDQRDL